MDPWPENMVNTPLTILITIHSAVQTPPPRGQQGLVGVAREVILPIIYHSRLK